MCQPCVSQQGHVLAMCQPCVSQQGPCVSHVSAMCQPAWAAGSEPRLDFRQNEGVSVEILHFVEKQVVLASESCVFTTKRGFSFREARFEAKGGGFSFKESLFEAKGGGG